MIPDPGREAAWHSCGTHQVIPASRALVISEVSELWRKHAREPWKVIFPDLEWPVPEWDR